jgi:predicted ATP-grasp superfamily ATP-dependent carboligase
MRLLVYEWSVSGGLGRGDATDAIGREGRLMVRAVLEDALRDGRFEVGLLVDEGRPVAVPSGVRCLPVPPAAELDALEAASAAADMTLVVAPETDGILAACVDRCRAAGGRVLAPSAGFLEIASDKEATAAALAAAGVPVPAGRALAPGEPWPVGFVRPAVAKRRDGCGGEAYGVVGAGQTPAPSGVPLRIEALAPGWSVGVSCLGGTAGALPLEPLRHVFAETAAGPPRYLGGEPLADPAAARRAERLAVRAIAAISRAAAGPACGWVGVDMIVGSRPDGGDDRVLEVNPRLTTSFVGHAAGSATSLLGLLVDRCSAAGAEVPPPGRVSSPRFRIPVDDLHPAHGSQSERTGPSGRPGGPRHRRSEPQGG